MGTNPINPCWICGVDATSGEHGIKHSDLAALFEKPSQREPLFLHNSKQTNIPIGSFKSDKLKLPEKICPTCNNARSQPYDYAWERCSSWLRANAAAIQPGTELRPREIFPTDTATEMRNLHLYFVKLFGCRLAGTKSPIQLQPFADALLSGSAHPNVYLQIGRFPDSGIGKMAAISDIEGKALEDPPGSIVAGWFYELDGSAIQISYADDVNLWPGLKEFWHPRFGSGRLSFVDFGIFEHLP